MDGGQRCAPSGGLTRRPADNRCSEYRARRCHYQRNGGMAAGLDIGTMPQCRYQRNYYCKSCLAAMFCLSPSRCRSCPKRCHRRNHRCSRPRHCQESVAYDNRSRGQIRRRPKLDEPAQGPEQASGDADGCRETRWPGRRVARTSRRNFRKESQRTPTVEWLTI